MIRTDSMAVYYQPKRMLKTLFGVVSRQEALQVGQRLLILEESQAIVLVPGQVLGNRNILVGVTSWGYTDKTQQVQGASWFGQNKEFKSCL